MNLLDALANGALGCLVTLARLALTALETAEDALRALMSTTRLTGSTQTLLLIALLVVFLFAAKRLLKGRLRSAASFALVMTLAHTLEHLARL